MATSAPYIVCAYYTDSYQRQAENLLESLQKFDLPHHVEHVPSRGYWEANTRIKPEFLLDCLQRFPSLNIVYLDADAVVQRRPELFETLQCDVGVFTAPEGQGYSHRFLTGTLFLRNQPRVIDFVKSWVAAQEGVRLTVDQDSFELAVQRHPEIVLAPLPASYVKIFDRGDMGDDAVIEHFQASRQQFRLQRWLKRVRNAALLLIILGLLAVSMM